MSRHADHESAWYAASRDAFLSATVEDVTARLHERAVASQLEITPEQQAEWRSSVSMLQSKLQERLHILQAALASTEAEPIRAVILEFDFRRRGLRMDCILLGDGVLFVLEFKRSRVGAADRDQVMNYALNLFEFHKRTRDWCEHQDGLIVPMLVLTEVTAKPSTPWQGLAEGQWRHVHKRPIETDKVGLNLAIKSAFEQRKGTATVDLATWLGSPFEPSSSILDAALSLYGNHTVSAIREHAAAKEAIDASTDELARAIEETLRRGERRVLFLSGAPGAGKTLVGLDLVLGRQFGERAVFVTGNAPLVEVLDAALKSSYRDLGLRGLVRTGYYKRDSHFVAGMATFKLVKAHKFLGELGKRHMQSDGRILVFDEAQRTYEKGREVVGKRLEDHEADLILQSQEKSYPEGGTVVVALVGHQQAINRGERGLEAWLEAAERNGWRFSIGEETLGLGEIRDPERWRHHTLRDRLEQAHLKQSMRFYRNEALERWGDAVLTNDAQNARMLASSLNENGDTIWLARDLATAKQWGRTRTTAQRVGLIASGQARRLAAEGLFVSLKPDIADWMLQPAGDIRSSNALETVQNQYQVQGLELDYCIVCWDADLRREKNEWASYRIAGGDWQRDRYLDSTTRGLPRDCELAHRVRRKANQRRMRPARASRLMAPPLAQSSPA